MKQLRGLFAYYRGCGRGKKALIITAFLLMLFIIFMASAWMTGSFIRPFIKSDKSPILVGLHSGLTFTIIIFIVTVIVVAVALFKASGTNNVTYEDERGVTFLEKSTRGKAHFITPYEKERYFNIDDGDNITDFLMGQETENWQRVIAYKEKEKGAPGTKNILVLANSGQGKTFTIVKNNVIQGIKDGISEVVVDPSAEIYTSTGQYARNEECDVRALNMQNLDYSECWDCLGETTIDVKTGRVDSIRLQDFARIFTKNAARGENEDYWYKCAISLIETVIGYAAYQREKAVLKGYQKIYDRITRGREGTKFKRIIENEFVSFPWCEDKIMNAAEKYGIPGLDVKKAIQAVKSEAPAYNIGVVYDMIMEFKKIEENFALMPKYHPGNAAYKRYQSHTKETVRDGAIQGAQMKFKIFDSDKLRRVLSEPGINFNTINFKQSVYYLIIPDNTSIYRPIASLFFSFFYRDAQRNYDEEVIAATAEGRRNRCIPVMCLMDEFASLGVITGSEEDFATVMSDARKRKIWNVIIAQYYSQLEGIYGIYGRDAIVSNCSTLLCLGSNDAATNEFVAKACGMTTTQNETHTVRNTFFGQIPDDGTMSVSSIETYLLSPDEIGNMEDKVLIKRHGAGAYVANTLPWSQNPELLDGKCPEVSYTDNIKPLNIDPWILYSDPKDDNKKPKETADDLIMRLGAIKDEQGRYIDAETKEVVKLESSEEKKVLKPVRKKQTAKDTESNNEKPGKDKTPVNAKESGTGRKKKVSTPKNEKEDSALYD